ncbi:nucleotidyltransferase family protein [Sphingobium aquiterrae]|uniref:nucleotidyltransferase family protein n=1 Tax=Sphingobium aquiterrae TaxID=2038656 RepID=UPI003015E7CE
MIAADRVAAILLAAGTSRRFGVADKLLAPLDGQPLVAHAAATVAAMGFAHRIAVCASQDVAVSALLSSAGFDIARIGADGPDGHWPDMAASLARGVAVAEGLDVDAVLLCLGDMPFITGEHLAALLAAHGAMPAAVTASSDGYAAMPPALFGRGSFAALQAMRGDRGGRALLAQAVLVPALPGLLRDIDRPADLSSR